MKHKSNLAGISSLLVKAFWLTFLAFILPGWSSQSFLMAQVDPTKASSAATASAAPTEPFPPATDLPEPTKAETPTTPEPPPTKDSSGIGIAAGQWVPIHRQTFEGVFPATGWAVKDSSSDGFERFWDDDDYRPHPPSYWAAWPANGGAQGITPRVGLDNYPDNMDTRMIYGPFDLSDASRADTAFSLWRDLEDTYDYLTFEVSHDGITFEELERWTGHFPTWEPEDKYYDR